MRVLHVAADQFAELPELPAELPAQGFVWIGSGRREFELGHGALQAALQRWGCGPLVDLHVADLLNNQLPSHYDDTSWYDLLVFRRLAAAPGSNGPWPDEAPGAHAGARKVLGSIDTSPVGFAVFDRVLLTVHPTDCAVREHFAQRLASLGAGSLPGPDIEPKVATRLPTSAADLMLRMVNHMVDSYLELRRLLSRHLTTLQHELLDPKSRFTDWRLLLDARNALNQLEDTCEDQRAALQEWIDALDEWPQEIEPDKQRERELLRVRSRDVLEHIERVLSHVRRLEQSSEVAVQMHFSALGHRTNQIMRTLTVLTAVFLPLNLITGFFGMNFEFMPLIHTSVGFWIAVALMLAVGGGMAWLFWRKRYLSTSSR